MKALQRVATLGAAFSLLLALLPAGISAQDNPKQGVTISPSFKELVIGPGLLEAKSTITARNNTAEDLVAEIRLVDFDALGEFGGISFAEENAPPSQYSLVKWISLPTGKSVKLPAGKEIEIPLTIKNDDGLAPGGHYGAVILSISGDQRRSSNQIAFKQELASLLFVKKTGGETYGIQLDSIKADNLPKIPETVNLKFQGTGNVHVIPRGYIEITDPHGKVVAKGIINPESTLVMPGKARQFTTVIQPVDEPKAKGEYKITAFYRYDGKEGFETKSLSFNRSGISFVSTGIILLVLGLFTGVGVVIFHRKDRIKRIKK